MIKKFENFDSYINLENKFWFISGDTTTCHFMLDKFEEYYDINKLFTNLSSMLIGLYFANIGWDRWQYYSVIEDFDIKQGKKAFQNENIEYAGELKFENGEFFIDTLSGDLEKYNL